MSLATDSLATHCLADSSAAPINAATFAVTIRMTAVVDFVGQGGATANPVDVQQVTYETTGNTFEYEES